MTQLAGRPRRRRLACLQADFARPRGRHGDFVYRNRRWVVGREM